MLCLWVPVLGDKSVLLFLLSRSVLPLFQHGFSGVLLHLRLPARDQSQAPRGDRSTVRKPTLFLRRLGLGRGTAGRVHPGQRFKLPSVRQRRVWCGLEELDKSERVFPLLQWCLTETYRGVRSVIFNFTFSSVSSAIQNASTTMLQQAAGVFFLLLFSEIRLNWQKIYFRRWLVFSYRRLKHYYFFHTIDVQCHFHGYLDGNHACWTHAVQNIRDTSSLMATDQNHWWISLRRPWYFVHVLAKYELCFSIIVRTSFQWKQWFEKRDLCIHCSFCWQQLWLIVDL